MYWLTTRFYDPNLGRFVNADSTNLVAATPGSASYDKNLYTYCDNNPITRLDGGGNFWDTIFDVVSLVVSVVEVCKNPTDPMAWASLAGDAVDLIPGVTGVGETIRAAKAADTVVDVIDTVHDVGKTVDNVVDAGRSARSIKKTAGAITETATKTAQKGWNVGDDITNLTKAGNRPSWSTLRQRYWKNEAHYHPEKYPGQLERLKKGLAPIGDDGFSMELHHPNGRQGNDFFFFEPVTRTWHIWYHSGR